MQASNTSELNPSPWTTSHSQTGKAVLVSGIRSIPFVSSLLTTSRKELG